MKKINKPTILIIMDGWGIDKPNRGNAVSLAQTPNYNYLLKKYPNTKLNASGKYVGLPRNQFGNSEAGHLNIGAGRIVKQDSTLINEAISKGTFYKNPAFVAAIKHVKKNNSNMHLMGLLSGFESAHAERDHLLALMDLASSSGIKNIYLHFFTDGRDAPQYAAVKYIKKIQENFKNGEKIATISGRFYAMDRNKKWDRTQLAYDAITLSKGREAATAEDAILEAYNRNETDEYIEPTVINHKSGKIAIKNNDAIIYYNLRSDRARQLTKVFVQPHFNKMNPGSFIRSKVLKNIKFVAMTDFGPDLGDVMTAYPSEDVKETLPEVLKDHRQLYIAESEKFAHVTYFFNGGYADPIGGESRMMIPSPNVKSYDKTPAMSIKEVIKVIIDSLTNNKYDFICVNFANPDMVAHTGNLTAGIKAVEVVDAALGKIYKVIKKKKGNMIVTADHGNVEGMINLKTGEVDTEHSANLVPFIIITDKKYKLAKQGVLGNIAPTVLDIMNVPASKPMINSLILKK